MKKFETTIAVTVVDYDELSLTMQSLLTAAIMARHNAQCGYSGFAVGAAVRTLAGDIALGVNVENSNWTCTTHAEQTAVATAVTNFGANVEIEAVAVVAAHGTERINGLLDVWGPGPDGIEAIFGPCGTCRQILLENAPAKGSMTILVLQPNGTVAVMTLDDLFPMAFGPKNL